MPTHLSLACQHLLISAKWEIQLMILWMQLVLQIFQIELDMFKFGQKSIQKLLGDNKIKIKDVILRVALEERPCYTEQLREAPLSKILYTTQSCNFTVLSFNHIYIKIPIIIIKAMVFVEPSGLYCCLWVISPASAWPGGSPPSLASAEQGSTRHLQLS